MQIWLNCLIRETNYQVIAFKFLTFLIILPVRTFAELSKIMTALFESVCPQRNFAKFCSGLVELYEHILCI